MKIPDILFHGTSTRRWRRIQKDGLLRVAPVGLRVISMSEDPRVALHFAEMAVFGDRYDSPRCRTGPIILAVNAKALLSKGYELVRLSDPVWGEGACDWELEVASRINVPLDFVMETNLTGILPPHPAEGPGAQR